MYMYTCKEVRGREEVLWDSRNQIAKKVKNIPVLYEGGKSA